jgi:hypothetical protein
MVTLAGIVLPLDMVWVDEFSGHGVGQVITPTLTSALVVEESAQPSGRKFTLESDGAWVDRSTVLALQALVETPLDGTTITLVWADGRTFGVVFDRGSGAAVEAEEVYRLAAGDHTATHVYSLTLRLITT